MERAKENRHDKVLKLNKIEGKGTGVQVEELHVGLNKLKFQT